MPGTETVGRGTGSGGPGGEAGIVLTRRSSTTSAPSDATDLWGGPSAVWPGDVTGTAVPMDGEDPAPSTEDREGRVLTVDLDWRTAMGAAIAFVAAVALFGAASTARNALTWIVLGFLSRWPSSRWWAGWSSSSVDGGPPC